MKIKKITNLFAWVVLPVMALLGTAVTPSLKAATNETYTFTTNRVVPDGNAAGLSDVRNISSAIGTITSLKVRLKIAGEYNGDLYGYVRHGSGFTVLLNRPGKTASEPSGYADSGFDVTFQTGAANGDVHVYQNVTVPPNGSPLTGVWQPDGRYVDPRDVTDTSPRTTSLTDFNGLSAGGEWTLFLADLEAGATNMLKEWALEISGMAYPTLAWATPSDIIYGTALGSSQLNATATYNSTNVPGTFTYTPAAGTVLNAGLLQTLSVTFTPTDTNSFLPATANVAINVQKASVTITAANKTKAYGAALPAFTANYSGFVNGDDASDLDTPATLATTATASSSVGTYAITASGAADANYAITHVNGTLTITQALTAGVLASSANPALPGASVTFTMTLSPVAPGAGTPNGTVNFRIDGSIAGSGTLSGGVATFSTASLTPGQHTVVAEYAGGVNFVGTTNTLTPNQAINTPPVAGNDTIERYPGEGVKVRVSTLLSNDSDGDLDTLVVTFSPTSANGGIITVAGAWVFYIPAPGFTNADSFTYTITDGRGGSAVGTVSVRIKVDSGPSQNLVITLLGGGLIRITGSGIPNRLYRLQYTETLVPANWLDIEDGSVTADGAGVFEIIDTPGAGTRYYRSVFP